MWYINLLIGNFPRYGLGFSWEGWFIIHHVLTVVLLGLTIVRNVRRRPGPEAGGAEVN